MQNTTDCVVVASRIDPELRDRLAVIAHENGRSIAGELRFLIRQTVESLRPIEQR